VTPADGGLDDIDRAIIGELQEDGRRTFREIGRTLDLSERTIRTRVHRMQSDGVLRILAFADPYRVGDSVLAMVLLRVAAGAHDRVVETLTAWPEVSYISSLLGRWDVYAQLVCRDNDALWHLVTERLRALEGVEEIETGLEVRVHKFVYSYPTLAGQWPAPPAPAQPPARGSGEP
jgi:Lrp/AsnC family transcriptional regulator, regulator for asnA, asnC and gidA